MTQDSLTSVRPDLRAQGGSDSRSKEALTPNRAMADSLEAPQGKLCRLDSVPSWEARSRSPRKLIFGSEPIAIPFATGATATLPLAWQAYWIL